MLRHRFCSPLWVVKIWYFYHNIGWSLYNELRDKTRISGVAFSYEDATHLIFNGICMGNFCEFKNSFVSIVNINFIVVYYLGAFRYEFWPF